MHYRNVSPQAPRRRWFDAWYPTLLPLSLAGNAAICYFLLAR